jgi:hypothetical protein
LPAFKHNILKTAPFCVIKLKVRNIPRHLGTSARGSRQQNTGNVRTVKHFRCVHFTITNMQCQ